MKTISLNGDYLLRYYDQQLEVPPAKEDMQSIPAKVPGNVEIDLMNAGILPDIYFGNNIKQLRPYEFYGWIYEKEFEAPEVGPKQRIFLNFGGVDCVATYFLNGQEFAKSDNALIEHRFDVTDIIKPGKNLLEVKIDSPILYAAQQGYEANSNALEFTYEGLKVRKAPSQYGWDIMPRAVSAGLWRDVELQIENPTEIDRLYLATVDLGKDSAWLTCTYQLHTDVHNYADLALRITGCLKGAVAFVHEKPITFVAGRFEIQVQNPALWWPMGYGEANVYDIKCELLHKGETIADYDTSLGIRKVKLNLTDITDAKGGDFSIHVNGEKILCKGSNWVPADAMHSRDAGRYERMLDLWVDTNSNILRCWGGNVYEDHAFYDYCDRHGIMIWQDFTMACGLYPLDEAFLDVMRKEAESVVIKLRNHPSIILWSGDNECDAFYAMAGSIHDPAVNRLTREVLPQVVVRQDPYRQFLPSSPYISPETFKLSGGDYGKMEQLMPENHLWGPRDYYKSTYYSQAVSHFVSETGYHGCNSLSSMKNFISPDKLWPWQNNDEWLTHAAEMSGETGPYAYRIQLMADQIHEMFGFDPDNLEDFILASQMSQAEAKKFFVEITRVKKWRRTGVIWWNMIDGWPQFSDAVVSYDYIKKLAYYYIKRSQQPLCLMMSEPQDWHINLMAGNDTLQDSKGSYRVTDGDTGEVVAQGEFEAPKNATTQVCAVRISHGDQRLFLIEWEAGGVKGANHYVLGMPPLSFEQYKAWLPKIAALDGSFDAQSIGR